MSAQTLEIMQYLNSLIGSIELSKKEFCAVYHVTPYRLRKAINRHIYAMRRLGYSQYDKRLTPPQVRYIADALGYVADEAELTKIIRSL